MQGPKTPGLGTYIRKTVAFSCPCVFWKLFWIYRVLIWDEFLRHFRLCDGEDSGLSDEEQKRKGPNVRPKRTRKRMHQAKKNFQEKFKTVS